MTVAFEVDVAVVVTVGLVWLEVEAGSVTVETSEMSDTVEVIIVVTSAVVVELR